jgi:hypothetical protein
MLFDEQPTDLDLVRYLLGEMYDDLGGRVARSKYLSALDSDYGGAEGTMIFGGTPAFLAYQDARGSWIAGNYVATVLVCQALLENLLTATSMLRPSKLQSGLDWSRRSRSAGRTGF